MKLERDPRFKNLELLVGVFVVGALIAILVAIFYFGTEVDLFGDRYFLRFESDTGTGLAEGMPVKLSGFLIGRIQEVELDDRAKVIVRMRIDQEYSKWIRKDSVATLVQEGLIGASIIDISVGSPELPVLEEEAFLPFEEEEALTDIALALRESVDNVLAEVRETIAYVNDPQGEIKRTLANVERLTAGLEETRRKADDLVLAGTEDARRAGLLIDSLSAAADNLSVMVDNAAGRLPVLLDHVEGTLSNAENTSLQVRKTAEEAAPRVSPLLLEAEELVSDTGDLVEGMKGMWPFRNHVPRDRNPEIVPGDSHE